MQMPLTPLQQSKDDRFADNSGEDAEEVDTSLSSVSIVGRQFAPCGLLMISIFWEAVKNNCDNLLKC